MAIISPVSDLRNYNTVLEQVSAGSPVYLTVNGRGRFTIRDIADDEEFEKAKAMLRLMCASSIRASARERKKAGCPRMMSGHTSTANANED